MLDLKKVDKIVTKLISKITKKDFEKWVSFDIKRAKKMDRISQIEKEIEEIETFLEEHDDELRGVYDKENPMKSYEAYENKRRPYTSKINKLDRERRLIMPAVFDEISDYGDVMTLVEFVDCVKSGGFIDYDGHGRYVKDNKKSNILIYPSDVKHNSIRTDFDTIIWFNR